MSPTALTPTNPITLSDLIGLGNAQGSNTGTLSSGIPSGGNSTPGAYTPSIYAPNTINGNNLSQNTITNAQNVLSQAKNSTSAQSAPTTKQPSFWDKLAPTIGGIAGGIGGDVLGGLLAVPTAGIVNPWDASTALSALGGGVGQAISNEGNGKGLGLSSDLKEAALMGSSNLAGLGIAKGLGGVSSAIASKGASQAASDATTDLATKVYNAVPKSVRQAYDLSGSQSLASDAGIDPNSFADMATQGHAVNNAVDSKLNDALAGQSIDTSDLSKLNDALNAKVAMRSSGISAQIKGLSPAAQSVVDAFDKIGYDNPAVKTYIDQIGKISQGLLNDTGSTDAQAFRQATKQVGDLYGSSIPTGTAADTGAVNPIQKGASDALNTLYHYMDDTTYGADGAEAAIKNMTPDITADQIGGNQKLADMANEAIQSGDKQQIKDFLHSTGNMASIGDAANTAAKGIVPKTAATAATDANGLSKVAKIAKPVLGLAGAGEETNGKSKTDKIIGAAMMAPEALDLVGGGAGTQGAGNLISAAGKIGRVAPMAATGLTSMPQAQPTANTSIGIPSMDTSIYNNPTMLALRNALGGGSDASAISSILPAAQKQMAAMSALNTLASLYNQAGGAQGTGNGLLSRLQGLIPGSAQGQYLRQQPGLANILAGMTGNTPSAAASQMPTFTQTPQTAQTNLTGLANALGLNYQ